MARLRTSPVLITRTLPTLNRWHWLAGAVLVLTVGLPLAVTALGSLVSLLEAGSGPSLRVIARAAYGTAASSVASTLVGVAVGLPLADLLGTLRGYTGRILRFVAWLPLGVPPLVYALGVRRIIEVLGLSEALLDPATVTLPLLPPMLAQSAIAIAVTVAALATFRRPSGTTDRVAGDDVARVLGAPEFLRSWTADPVGTRTGLLVGACLCLIHGLSSVATTLAFPAATSLNLGATLVRGAPAAALLAATPLFLTLPLLLVARRLAIAVERDPDSGPTDATSPERSDRRAAAATAAIVSLYALVPLGAVLFTGLGPVAVGALLLNEPGVDFPALATTTLAMLGAAVLGAALPIILSVPPTLEAARRSTLPWVAIVIPTIAFVLATAPLDVRPLAAGLLLHVVLGFAAALPVFHTRWRRTPRGALDSARVLGASTLQTIWWEDRDALARLLGAVVAAGVVASLGDVTMGALSGSEARGLGTAAVAFLAVPEGERGAFALSAVLALVGIAALLALEAGRAAIAPMWWRS